jgi:AcrR family transcriptional regulator
MKGKIMAQHNISLRERKHVQTKLALTKAVIKRLKTKRLKDISVEELCEEVLISKVTFHNYFPRKTDILVYIWQLWHLEAAWHFQQWEQGETNIEIIEAYFEFIGRGIEKGAWVLNEVFAFLMQKREAFSVPELSVAERVSAFPDLPGIEDVQVPKHPGQNIELCRYVNRAIAQGELPKKTDPEMVVNILNSILGGVLMTLLRTDPMQIRPTYRAMLQVFWQWLRSESFEILKESSTEDRQPQEMTENIWMEIYLLS